MVTDLISLLLWMIPPVTVVRILILLSKYVSLMEVFKAILMFVVGCGLITWYFLASLDVSVFLSLTSAAGMSLFITALLQMSKTAR